MTTKAAVKPIPDGYRSITPYMTIRGAAKAIEFYKQAFGAQELSRMPGQDGRLMHAEIKIGDSIIMISDEFPEMGHKGSPETLGGTTVGLMIYTADCDAMFARAIAHGAKETMPLANMFWGDRYGRLTDPFGHHWSIGMHIEDVAPEEMARRAAAEMTAQASKKSN